MFTDAFCEKYREERRGEGGRKGRVKEGRRKSKKWWEMSQWRREGKLRREWKRER